MQLPLGIVRSILFAIICFYFLIIPVCASGINTTPDITQNIHSSPVENITPVPLAPDNNKRLAPINPDFIAFTKMSAGKNDMVIQNPLLVSGNGQRSTGFIPPTTNLSYTAGQDVTEYIRSDPASDNFPITAGEYPSRFDLRTLSKVTPVRDQGTASSCWAFATYASLESYLLPTESWNFSENNMKNLLGRDGDYPEGFDFYQYQGGNYIMSLAYLARWTGPVSEADDPYNATSITSPTDIPAKKHVQNVMFLPDRYNDIDNNNIKSTLTTYGAVYTSMFYYNIYFNETTKAYYYPYSGLYSDSPNHAVAIVGWDDNYSKTNFPTSPPADGAFIIKNSWGTDWGDQGYFYVSYNDTKIGLYNAVFTAESAQNYDNIYQYDPLGWVGSFGGTGHTEWGANMFTSNSSETLSAVSFYAVDTNTSYEIFIYKNPDKGPVNTTGYLYSQKGTISGPPGYYTKIISPGIVPTG